MLTLAMSVSRHNTIRLMELGGALVAVGGAALFVGATMPFGKRGGQILGGLCLAAAGVLVVIAWHWGRP